MKQLVFLTVFMVVAVSCSDKLDIDLGNEIDGTWLLTRTCLNGACQEPEEGVEITIEFDGGNLIERENDQTIGASSYIIIETINEDNSTTISLNVNNVFWIAEVKTASMRLIVGEVIREYNRQ